MSLCGDDVTGRKWEVSGGEAGGGRKKIKKRKKEKTVRGKKDRERRSMMVRCEPGRETEKLFMVKRTLKRKKKRQKGKRKHRKRKGKTNKETGST